MELVLSVVGVAAGALITYVVNVRDRRRQHVERLFNEAIAAVVAAQAAMEFVNNVPPEAGLSPDRAVALEATLREEGYRRFVQLVAAAREAVATVVPYRDDLRLYLSGVAVVADRADDLIAELKKGANV